MPENTELMARLLANDLVQMCDKMTELTRGLVDLSMKAGRIAEYPQTLPSQTALRRFARDEASSLIHLGDLLAQVGRNHGAKYQSRGLEVHDELVALQKRCGYDLGVDLEDEVPF